MPEWSPPAFGGAALIAVYYLMVRAAAGRIEDRLGSLVLELAACVGIAASMILGGRSRIPTTGAGVALSAAGGLAVSFASILLFMALRKGGPVASTGTIVLGGGVALSGLVAPWLFGESFTVRRLLGVALGLAAMWVLGTES